MLMKTILTCFLLVLLQKNALAEYTCVPETDCSTLATPGTLVPDPQNCENYYMCIRLPNGDVTSNGQPTSCPAGQYFEAVNKTCQPETIPGTCDTNYCFTNVSSLVCSSQCPSPITEPTIIANKEDCSSYYLCTKPNTILVQCTTTPDLYFDGIECQADATKCCDFCTPFCSVPFTLIQNPCNCSAYYACNDVGQLTPYACTSGQYFDETTGRCVTGPCTARCTTCGQEPNPGTATTVNPTCPNTYTCSADGNYARCSFCDPSYFHCLNGVATIQSCFSPYVFNTDSGYRECITIDQCPYHPTLFNKIRQKLY